MASYFDAVGSLYGKHDHRRRSHGLFDWLAPACFYQSLNHALKGIFVLSIVCIIRTALVIFVLGAMTPISWAQIAANTDGAYQIVGQGLPDGSIVVAVLHTPPDVGRTDLLNYQGDCIEKIEADMVIAEQSHNKAFEASGVFKDLQAGGLTDRFVEKLQAICPKTSTLDIILASRPDRPVVATLSKASGWMNTAAPLSAAVAENPIERQLEQMKPRGQMVGIAMQDPLLRLQIRGYFECGENMFVSIASTGSPMGRKHGLPILRNFAEKAAPHIKDQCPEVTRIRFSPPGVSDDFYCGPDGCGIDATLSGSAWTTVASGYRSSAELYTIKSVDDLLERMLNADYDELRERYSGYYMLFHNEFLFVYSERCRANIADPVSFEVTPIERTIDQDGFTVASRQSAPTYTLTIDRKFEQRYFAYKNANNLRLTSEMMSGAVDAMNSGRPASDISSVVSGVMDDRRRLFAFMDKGCTSEDVETAYARLDKVLGP